MSGFAHYAVTLPGGLCFAYQLEYAKDILCGVDLYERRYFFLKYDVIRDIDLERGARNTSIHNTRGGTFKFLKLWSPLFAEKNVKFTY